MTSTLRSYASTVQFIVQPEKTYYLVNVPMILAIAFMFEAFCRQMPRPNPGHPLLPAYASMVVYAFMCKLVEVGVKTLQVRIDPSQFPSYDIVMLPASIMMLIECFGEYVDPNNGVVIAPKITLELLKTLADLACTLWSGPGVAEVRDPANWRNYIEICYGRNLQAMVNIAAVADSQNIGINFRGTSNDDVREAAFDLSMKVYTLNVQPFAALPNTIQVIIAPPGIGPIASSYLQGQNPLAPVANSVLTPATVQILNSGRAYYQSAQDPFVNAGALPPQFDGLFPTANGGTVALCAHQAYLQKYFEIQKLSLHHIGNGAPLCISHTIRQSTTVETMLRQLTVQEALLGAMLGQERVYLVDSRGMLLNYASTGKFHPVSSTPIPAIASTMIGRGLQESLKSGHF